MVKNMNRKLIKKIYLQIRGWDIRGAWYSLVRRKYLNLDSNQFEVSLYGNLYNGFRVYESDLKKSSIPIVYSFGIGEDLSFSERLMLNIKPQIYAYDPTPRAIEYVKQHSLFQNELFHFFPFGLSDKDETSSFFLPSNDSHDCSGSAIHCNHLKGERIDVEMKCLNTIIRENRHTHIDLLKLDIEGSEFEVINSLKECTVPINQICLEIHDRFFENGLNKLRNCLATLREMNYLLISISYSEQELTFIRKDVPER